MSRSVETTRVTDQEVRTLVSDFFRSVEQRQLEQFLGLFAPGRHVTVFEDRDLRDWDAFAEFAKEFFQAIESISFQLEQCAVHELASTAAVATGVFSCLGTTVTAEPIALRNAFTFVLVRQADGWRIAHVHESSLGAQVQDAAEQS